MKISATFVLATVAVSVSAGGPKNNSPRFSGLNKIPDNEPLPLHQAPDCYQNCFQSTNHALTGDINTVNQREFCEDKWTHFDWWFETWLMGCRVPNCPKEDGDKARRWFDSICRSKS
ncbi:hypothetical protein COL154_002965 [Colletotrichum chrysophilum]|uniref:Avirulence Effector AvrLm4-7 domain-containing protein n=1 Tax=Colletotrichum chrysophilum TaxID=1836956 RepID=A0AAD9EPD7_9PEZI|nr:uncharacterized protein COL26b_004477 [Colletotrichum chrysophilum]KAJ0367745.1 hypothetical protein COL154_002965 [Colletotrichum chrysophilum]KAJ0377287.1 hypothetical protein COL26b_004477 [Colletotrichum chrysophilum]KAK1856095.1 hypothetical protein CCHR01_01309 [Colletotrichum chrysophilum]